VLTVTARSATTADAAILEDLYRELESEMVALKPVWRLTDGLPEPIDASLTAAVTDEDSAVIVGEIEGVAVGLLLWREVELLPQAAGRSIGVIQIIFTSAKARHVGVGEAMIERFLEEAEERGVELFDAVVPPGHREAKNFFESNGFKARRIVMHRDNS
jgi:ribosomal protein S18 acetylase RimI-like enzyme